MPNQAQQIRRQLKQTVRKMKRITGRRMEKAQWFIGKNINRKTFYVAEQRSAHKYISRYLSNRTDVILITVVNK